MGHWRAFLRPQGEPIGPGLLVDIFRPQNGRGGLRACARLLPRRGRRSIWWSVVGVELRGNFTRTHACVTRDIAVTRSLVCGVPSAFRGGPVGIAATPKHHLRDQGGQRVVIQPPIGGRPPTAHEDAAAAFPQFRWDPTLGADQLFVVRKRAARLLLPGNQPHHQQRVLRHRHFGGQGPRVRAFDLLVVEFEAPAFSQSVGGVRRRAVGHDATPGNRPSCCGGSGADGWNNGAWRCANSMRRQAVEKWT